MNVSPQSCSPLEIWGGVECSRVRLAGRVEDELARTGHDCRLEDLDRFASLGLRTLRYPILWERHASQPIDWSWADERLNRLRALGIRPIVGFVHHGGGPLQDGLLDGGFVEGLATFAGQFAQRYPWVDAFTPINEPLTTARFSGLYGMWHPFGCDSKVFTRIMLNECQAVRRAMAAIRKITPHAQLVQTEDIGKTHSTPFLAYQADFENERRWLTFDLLCGKLPRGQSIHRHLIAAGISNAELESFVEDPCPPDILGVNYYVTSERFLDERVTRYPLECRGGNERHIYADVPAVRVRAEGLSGPTELLRELWERYKRPIAVTEVQIACTREEQLRWLHEAWWSAQRLRAEGLDVRAITAWALLGAYDWDTLLMESRGNYESGAYDCRTSPPRATAVAGALRELATRGDFSHPALTGVGWWRRPSRLEFPAVPSPRTGSGNALLRPTSPNLQGQPLLILGATGRLGRAIARISLRRGLHAISLTHHDFDLTNAKAMPALLERHSPWAVINATSSLQIDSAENAPSHHRSLEAVAAGHLAEACAKRGARLAAFSSDFVFNGQADRPYVESDSPAPLNQYGRSKYEAEQAITLANPEALIIRTGGFFSPWCTTGFAPLTLQQLREGRIVKASEDGIFSPTYLPDLVNAALDLLMDRESGIWHVANQGGTTGFDWARLIASRLGCSSAQVVRASPEELGWIAPRPRYAVLGSERGLLLPPWEDALERFLVECGPIETSADSLLV